KPTFELSPEARKRNEQRNRPRGGLFLERPQEMPADPLNPDDVPPPVPPEEKEFVPEGAIIGYAIATYRRKTPDADGNMEVRLLQPGDDVVITTISGQRLAPVNSRFAVVDYFRSEMSEYDSNYVFVPLKYLQRLRTMEGRVTSIQIKLRPDKVRD